MHFWYIRHIEHIYYFQSRFQLLALNTVQRRYKSIRHFSNHEWHAAKSIAVRVVRPTFTAICCCNYESKNAKTKKMKVELGGSKIPPISIVLFTPYQTLISWRYIIISFYVLKLCTNEASMPNLRTYFQCWFLKTCICIKRGVIWWLWAGLKAKRLSFSYFLCKMNR